MTELWEDLSPEIFSAFWMTIKLTFFSAIGATIWGTVLTAFRVSPIPVLRAFGAVYVNVVRNTPLALIILFCSLGLSFSLNITLAGAGESSIATSNYRLAILGFILYTSAFVCETLRAGVNTVPLGQAEAARSIGFSFWQTLTLIVLPQAFRAVIAPLGSVYIALTKNTTIASVIGVAEASLLMKETIENHADLLVVVFALFALGFVIITLPMGLIFGYFGNRLAVKR